MLPHEFPFRLVDLQRGEAASASLTANANWLRGGEGLPSALLIEILAQAAILLLPETGEGGRGLLAGIDQAQFGETPLRPGERLEVRVERAGHFGRLAKVSGSIRSSAGELVCQASLLLARDG